MQLDCGACAIREWKRGDEWDLVQSADNPSVSRYLTDRFPNPYTLQDAYAWIDLNQARRSNTNFAITVGGSVAGGIGYELGAYEMRLTATIGYWLAEPFWGRGIATAALMQLTSYAFEMHGLRRISSVVMSPNLASARVLEKAGYVREGVLRSGAVKHGTVYDLLLYATVR
ncbi:MAG TPA: GNAT family protein [Candidatus Baltobacteraceae bacterium]|nr:GNAT family protein [Candidatus Baltobacteraceae bacterium]